MARAVVGVGGDYSREAINRGTAIIRGNTVYYIKRREVSRQNKNAKLKFNYSLM